MYVKGQEAIAKGVLIRGAKILILRRADKFVKNFPMGVGPTRRPYRASRDAWRSFKQRSNGRGQLGPRRSHRGTHGIQNNILLLHGMDGEYQTLS